METNAGFFPLRPLSLHPLTWCSDGSLDAMPQTQLARGFYLGWVLSNMRATSPGSPSSCEIQLLGWRPGQSSQTHSHVAQTGVHTHSGAKANMGTTLTWHPHQSLKWGKGETKSGVTKPCTEGPRSSGWGKGHLPQSKIQSLKRPAERRSSFNSRDQTKLPLTSSLLLSLLPPHTHTHTD